MAKKKIVVAKYQQQAWSCNSCDEKAWLHCQDYDIIIRIIDWDSDASWQKMTSGRSSTWSTLTRVVPFQKGWIYLQLLLKFSQNQKTPSLHLASCSFHDNVNMWLLIFRKLVWHCINRYKKTGHHYSIRRNVLHCCMGMSRQRVVNLIN